MQLILATNIDSDKLLCGQDVDVTKHVHRSCKHEFIQVKTHTVLQAYHLAL
eukprot:m.14029 g.14029  ORF g.14029 m.14029 type:complete len:51 (+) comp6118_c0_seq1:1667-1819(+)